MAYVFLFVAIIAEVIGTSALSRAEGFTRALPSLVALVAYGIAFFFLSLTLRTIPTGVAYAVWSGVGIVLIAAVAWLVQGQRLDAAAMIGMALIAAGVIVLNLFSRTAAH